METKPCTKCSSTLPISSFRSRIKKQNDIIYTYISSWCLKCEASYRKSLRTKAYRDSYKSKKKLEDPIKFHMQERISQWKHRDPKSDLTVSYLVDLWNAQGGYCYYSGQQMILGGTKSTIWQSASLDRINPSLGYCQGNVVWCTYRVNTMKGQLTRDQFCNLMKSILVRVSGSNTTETIV